MKRNIVVTGSAGFIGLKLVKELEKLGTHKVIGLDFRQGINVITCRLPSSVYVDYVYHLAAQSSVEASWHDPVHDMDNIRMTARIVDEYPAAKIIYSNSCAAMDKASPYGFSKWASGEYLKLFHKKYVSCVFPNIYGPGSRSVVDIFKDKDSVTVYGDGKQTRDYVHVDDIVNGLVQARNWEVGEYFMGSGQSLSVLDLVGKRKFKFESPRKEAREVVVPNTTPDWQPNINVFEYMNS